MKLNSKDAKRIQVGISYSHTVMELIRLKTAVDQALHAFEAFRREGNWWGSMVTLNLVAECCSQTNSAIGITMDDAQGRAEKVQLKPKRKYIKRTHPVLKTKRRAGRPKKVAAAEVTQ